MVAFQFDITVSRARCTISRPALRVLSVSGQLTQIASVVETIRAASITDTLFAFLKLFEQAEVAWNCGETNRVRVCEAVADPAGTYSLP